MKKSLIFYIYMILREYSDRGHRLFQQDILEIMKRDYGVECERKAVGANIKVLRELGEVFGFDIVEDGRGKGVYYERGKAELDAEEIKIFANALAESKAVGMRDTAKLTEKLCASLSMHERAAFESYIHK